MSDSPRVATAKAQVLAYNEKDWEAARNALTPDIVYDEIATHRRLEGHEDVIDAWRGWGAAFPDSRATFHESVESGDRVVLEITWRGTHTGPLHTPNGTIEPTGKEIDLPAIQVVQVAGDKVRSVRQYFDMATLLEQIGGQR